MFLFFYDLSFWFIVKQIHLAHSISRVYDHLNHTTSACVNLFYVCNDALLFLKFFDYIQYIFCCYIVLLLSVINTDVINKWPRSKWSSERVAVHCISHRIQTKRKYPRLKGWCWVAGNLAAGCNVSNASGEASAYKAITFWNQIVILVICVNSYYFVFCPGKKVQGPQCRIHLTECPSLITLFPVAPIVYFQLLPFTLACFFCGKLSVVAKFLCLNTSKHCLPYLFFFAFFSSKFTLKKQNAKGAL